MDARLNLVAWLVVAPILAALLAPLLGRFSRDRRPPHPALHLLLVLLALDAVRAATRSSIGYAVGPSHERLLLTLGRTEAMGITLLAVLFLVISLFSRGFIGQARDGSTFLSLLLLAQAAANLVLLAADLSTLYLALFVLSLSLMLMVGIDFSQSGGRAALRVFTTLEAPAILAAVSYWLIAARSGTSVIADIAPRAPWLGAPAGAVLVAPIALALVARVGLFPLHRWVVDGSRASATPAAVAIGAIAVPLGAYVLARLGSTILSLDPVWLTGLALLGGLTALVGGAGALGERKALGWLGYAAIGQVGIAVVGLSTQSTVGQAGGWMALVGGSLSIALLGLSLGLVTRATHRDGIEGPAALPRIFIARLSLGVGFLAVAGFPPLPTFTARQYLLASLIETHTAVDDVLAVSIVVGTLLLAAAAWKALGRSESPATSLDGNGNHAPVGARHPELVFAGATAARPPIRPSAGGSLSRASLRSVLSSPLWAVQRANLPRIEWEVRYSLSLLLVLIALLGLVGPLPLAASVGLRIAAPGLMGLAAAVILLLTLAAAVGSGALTRALGARFSSRRHVARRVVRLGERLHVAELTDPYLAVGTTLTFLGRFTASVLGNTLGRLARIR